jgi:hypothetical protein
MYLWVYIMRVTQTPCISNTQISSCVTVADILLFKKALQWAPCTLLNIMKYICGTIAHYVTEVTLKPILSF